MVRYLFYTIGDRTYQDLTYKSPPRIIFNDTRKKYILQLRIEVTANSV